ncbi:MAG: hypothetical protein ABSG84_13600 [Acidobacteriaceae bacterium]|jgi:hypothetical protein
MTHYSKFKVLSIFAGVISLSFGWGFVGNLALILVVNPYLRWSSSKQVRELGLLVRPNYVPPFAPNLSIGHVVGVAAMGIIAVVAFRCRSYLRRRMMFEQGSMRT